jgi:hypothetical protein
MTSDDHQIIYIVDDGHIQSRGSTLSSDSTVTNEYVPRKSKYYSITEAEINTYSQLGLISTILFVVGGLTGGFSLGCLVSIIQESSNIAAKTLLTWLAGAMGIVTLLFFGFAITLEIIKWYSKKSWNTSE